MMLSRDGSSSRPALKSAALGLFVLLALGFSCFGEPSYLPAGQPDGIALLAPPPLPGSSEEAADLASTRAVFKARTEAEKERALKTSTLSFTLFYEVVGCDLDLNKLSRTQVFL